MTRGLLARLTAAALRSRVLQQQPGLPNIQLRQGYAVVPAAVKASGAALKFGTAAKYVVGIGAAAAAVAASSVDEAVSSKLHTLYLVPMRLARDVYAATSIVTDYKTTLRTLGEGEREQALSACHQRSATKLLQLCFDNGGVYTKLGQHIGKHTDRSFAVISPLELLMGGSLGGVTRLLCMFPPWAPPTQLSQRRQLLDVAVFKCLLLILIFQLQLCGM